MSLGLYLVQTTPGAITHYATSARRAGLAFRVMPVQDVPVPPRCADEADDGQVTPMLLRLERAAEALDVSPSSLRRLIKAGELPAVKVHGATRVRVEDLRTYVERLAGPAENDGCG